MATGHIVNGQCVDVAASVDVFYSTSTPAQNPGSPSYLSILNRSASGWQQDTYSNGVLLSSTPAPSPSFPSCDTTQTFFDGMQLGWAVAAAMVLVYVIRRPYR